MLQRAARAGAQHQQIGAARLKLQRCIEVKVHFVPVMAHGLRAGEIGKEIGVACRQRQRRLETLDRMRAVARQQPGIAGLVVQRHTERHVRHAAVGRDIVQPRCGFGITLEINKRQRGTMLRRRPAAGFRPPFRIAERAGGIEVGGGKTAAIVRRIRLRALSANGRPCRQGHAG